MLYISNKVSKDLDEIQNLLDLINSNLQQIKNNEIHINDIEFHRLAKKAKWMEYKLNTISKYKMHI